MPLSNLNLQKTIIWVGSTLSSFDLEIRPIISSHPEKSKMISHLGHALGFTSRSRNILQSNRFDIF